MCICDHSNSRSLVLLRTCTKKALATKIPPRRLQFYTSHMLWQVACQYFGVVAIAELSKSLIAAGGGSGADAIAHANASVAALDSLFEAQRAAEGTGEWSGLYYGDRLDYTNMQSRRRSVVGYQHALLKLPGVYDSGKGYYSMYQYQAPKVASYPLSSYTAEWNTRDFVSMTCSNTSTASGGCHDGADGGVFFGDGATVAFVSTRCRGQVAGQELPAGPGAGEQRGPGKGPLLPLEACAPEYVAMYTLDGSHPSTSNTATRYTGPFAINATTDIRALVAVNGTHRPLVHNATFSKHLKS